MSGRRRVQVAWRLDNVSKRSSKEARSPQRRATPSLHQPIPQQQTQTPSRAPSTNGNTTQLTTLASDTPQLTQLLIENAALKHQLQNIEDRLTIIQNDLAQAVKQQRALTLDRNSKSHLLDQAYTDFSRHCVDATFTDWQYEDTFNAWQDKFYADLKKLGRTVGVECVEGSEGRFEGNDSEPHAGNEGTDVAQGRDSDAEEVAQAKGKVVQAPAFVRVAEDGETVDSAQDDGEGHGDSARRAEQEAEGQACSNRIFGG